MAVNQLVLAKLSFDSAAAATAKVREYDAGVMIPSMLLPLGLSALPGAILNGLPAPLRKQPSSVLKGKQSSKTIL